MIHSENFRIRTGVGCDFIESTKELGGCLINFVIEISRSIVLEDSKILNVNRRIEDSLIGRKVTVQRSPIRPRGHKFTLGDNSNLGLLTE